MRLQILSDLHIEFGDLDVPDVGADVVVLAGDIHTKGRAVEWAQQRFGVPVVLVPGNHDFYGGSLGHTLARMRERAAGSGVHLLQDDELVCAGVRFLGCTLWTDYQLTGNAPAAMAEAVGAMTDFRTIRDDHFSRLKPESLAARHGRSREFLARRLADPFEGKTVVVTHHGCSRQSIHPRFASLPGHMNASFASELGDLMGGARVALWIHGHTHESLDYSVDGTRVVCNPRGYQGIELNPGFRPDFVIDL